MDDAEGSFLLAALLDQRARGAAELHLAGGVLHRALARLLAAEGPAMQARLGARPLAHPLFGTFDGFEGALDEALRAGLLDYLAPACTTVVWNISADTARALVARWTDADPTAARLLDGFHAALQQEAARGAA